MNWKRSAVVLITGLLIATAAPAFFDELVALKAELAQWEAVHAEADFTDILEQLDDIAGTVFVDVEDGAWYAPFVTTLAEWGIVSGYRDPEGTATGQFGPANPVTVAEVLKMASEGARMDIASCPAPQRLPQTRGHWAEPYVGCAEERGVRVLVGGTLDLNRPATRVEVVAVIHDLFADDVPPVEATFTDTLGHRFGADVAYASLLGIVGGDTGADGKPTGTFRPNDSINRAEAAKILMLRIKEEARREIL